MAIADADVLSAAAGDQAALARLYGRYNKALVRSAQRIVHDGDAEDMAQTAWLKIATNMRTFRGDATFSTWATRIVMNESLMLLRARSRRPDTPLVDLPVSGLQESRVRNCDAQRLLGTLPKRYRAVAELVYLEGFDHQEVAERLGLNVNTVKCRASRALLMMRRKARAEV